MRMSFFKKFIIKNASWCFGVKNTLYFHHIDSTMFRDFPAAHLYFISMLTWMTTIYSDGRTLEPWIQPSSATALSQSWSHKMPAAIWEQLNMWGVGALRLRKGIRKEKEEGDRNREGDTDREGKREILVLLEKTNLPLFVHFDHHCPNPSATSPGWQP